MIRLSTASLAAVRADWVSRQGIPAVDARHVAVLPPTIELGRRPFRAISPRRPSSIRFDRTDRNAVERRGCFKARRTVGIAVLAAVPGDGFGLFAVAFEAEDGASVFVPPDLASGLVSGGVGARSVEGCGDARRQVGVGLLGGFGVAGCLGRALGALFDTSPLPPPTAPAHSGPRTNPAPTSASPRPASTSTPPVSKAPVPRPPGPASPRRRSPPRPRCYARATPPKPPRKSSSGSPAAPITPPACNATPDGDTASSTPTGHSPCRRRPLPPPTPCSKPCQQPPESSRPPRMARSAAFSRPPPSRSQPSSRRRSPPCWSSAGDVFRQPGADSRSIRNHIHVAGSNTAAHQQEPLLPCRACGLLHRTDESDVGRYNNVTATRNSTIHVRSRMRRVASNRELLHVHPALRGRTLQTRPHRRSRRRLRCTPRRHQKTSPEIARHVTDRGSRSRWPTYHQPDNKADTGSQHDPTDQPNPNRPPAQRTDQDNLPTSRRHAAHQTGRWMI